MNRLTGLLRAFWEGYGDRVEGAARQAAWFGISLLLALIIWIAATSENDPIHQRLYSGSVSIRRANLDPNMVLVNESEVAATARVTIRAPQSTWDRLRDSDIVLRADFAGLPPGDHVIPLQASLSLPGEVVSVQPSQINVQLDSRSSKTVPVSITLTGSPAVGFEAREPQPALAEVKVIGPASLVGLVTQAYANVPIDDASASVQATPSLAARTADGQSVDNVQFEPTSVDVTVPIQLREGFKRLSVQPRIVGRPPVGYTWQVASYTPETITVTGSQTRLNNLTGAAVTEPIELWDQTETFERNVSVVLPRDIMPVTEETIRVRIIIDAVEGLKEFENVTVEVRGLPPDYRAEITPSTVTMYVAGPRPVVDALTDADVHARVDLTGLEPDTHQLQIEPIIAVEGFDPGQISLLPSVVTVQIIDTGAPTSTATITPAPTIIIVTPDTPAATRELIVTATPQD
ncbi:MAG: hypothetical protein JXB47_05785 [Anaerolineae bacterium]|nr:hypothetical protein [Anaerolineae bacterium]